MSDFEDEIERLKREIAILEGKKNQIPTYSFSKISDSDLYSLVDIEENFEDRVFNSWFNNQIDISSEIEEFLIDLIEVNKNLLYSYSEEDLKIHFLSSLFLKVNFKSIENNLRDFYNEKITYKTDKFILTGEADFLFAKGLKYSTKPYFFIQEFKKGKKNSDPEPQLLAEMISGLEISNVNRFKGAYIIGAIWNFVILEKLGDNKYQYFVSANFDSSKIDDLKSIYKNLMFIKREVLEKLER